MAHTFDIMEALSRNIRDFASHARRSVKIPEHIYAMGDRALKSSDDIVIDPSKPVSIDKCFKSEPGVGNSTTIYTCISSNINTTIVDKFLITMEAKTSQNNSTIICSDAIGIIMPKQLFEDDTDMDVRINYLIDVFGKVMDLDKNLLVGFTPAVLKLYKSSEIKPPIPMYDVEMMACAIGFIYITLQAWYEPDNKDEMINPDFVLDHFEDDAIGKEAKDILNILLVRHCKTTRSLKDAVGTGKLLAILFE